MISFSRQQHVLGQTIAIALILANIFLFKSDIFGIILGMFWLWFNSRKLADIFAKNIHQGFKNLLGFLIILAYISLIYTISYHLYEINWWIFLFILVSIPTAVEILSFAHHSQHYFFSNLKFRPINLSGIRKNILPILAIALDVLLIIGLAKNASVGIIRSPWELLSYKFWTIFILSNFFLILTILDKKSQKNILLISFHFLALSAIGIILYPLGFGYDSFIHGAVIKTIADTGTIEPRLFLYLGQYGLTLFFSNLTSLDILTLNKWLMPILFSIIWPSSIFYGLRYGLNWPFKISYLACLWSLVIGFNFAVMTTPQSLAYLFLAMIIFILPVINKNAIHISFIWAISAMTMSIHPLGGVPLLFLSIFISIAKIKKFPILKKILWLTSAGLSAISLPLLFALYQKINGVSWQNIFNLSQPSINKLPSISWHDTYSFTLDMIHNIGANFFWLYIFGIILGLFFIYKNNKYLFFKQLFVFIIVIFVNYILADLFLSFNLQINYQQDDYINRIKYILAIAFLPIFLTSWYFFWQKTIRNSNFWAKGFLAIISLLLMTISTYFSYPVYDKHQNSKSFNVSQTDIKTVEFIEDNSAGEPYIVLANQMVGAASIYRFGFAHYYNDNFYYSMPLGADNIYQNYLNMIETEASQDEALAAMEKAGVNKLYFVVNNYWHSAKQAIGQAELSSQGKILIDNGVNTIFVYQR